MTTVSVLIAGSGRRVFFKTRAEAVEAVRAGHVLLNDHRTRSAKTVRCNDRLRIRRKTAVYHITVQQLINKRVSAAIAAQTYVEDPDSIERRELLRQQHRCDEERDEHPDVPLLEEVAARARDRAARAGDIVQSGHREVFRRPGDALAEASSLRGVAYCRRGLFFSRKSGRRQRRRRRVGRRPTVARRGGAARAARQSAARARACFACVRGEPRAR